MPKKNVEISAKMGESYLIELNARQFNFKIDQPAPSGVDSAPTPLEYFLASLAGCMCTIGKIICDQRKIGLKGIDVKVVGDIDTDVLLGKKSANENRAGFTTITMQVNIDAPLSKEEKEALVKEIESRCPLADNVAHSSIVNVVVS